MHDMTIGVTAGVLLNLAVTAASAHQATELYIPLGQSPGVSRTLTDIGTIDAVSAAARSITVSGRTVGIVAATKIYLDRSLLKQTSMIGEFADLQPGRTVEIRYQDSASRKTARWLKVQLKP